MIRVRQFVCKTLSNYWCGEIFYQNVFESWQFSCHGGIRDGVVHWEQNGLGWASLQVLQMCRKNTLGMHNHPSIHFLYHLSFTGWRGAGADPSWLWARGRVHPGQVASQSQGRHIETDNYSHTHIHTYGQFRVTNEPNLHVFWLWEEAGVPGENPHRHEERKPRPAPVGWWIWTQNLLAVRRPFLCTLKLLWIGMLLKRCTSQPQTLFATNH